MNGAGWIADLSDEDVFRRPFADGEPYFEQVKVTNHFPTTGDQTAKHCFLKGGGLHRRRPLDMVLHTKFLTQYARSFHAQ